jgi:hypothetical protein
MTLTEAILLFIKLVQSYISAAFMMIWSMYLDLVARILMSWNSMWCPKLMCDLPWLTCLDVQGGYTDGAPLTLGVNQMASLLSVDLTILIGDAVHSRYLQFSVIVGQQKKVGYLLVQGFWRLQPSLSVYL